MFWITLDIVLKTFKYGGLILAWVAGFWGTISDMTEKKPRAGTSHKRLTSSGKKVVCLTLAGLLTSSLSMLFEDVLARQAAASRQEAANKRTRDIIVASQSLRSLRLEWSFTNVPKALTDQSAVRKARQEEIAQWEETDGHSYMADEDYTSRFIETHVRLSRIYPFMCELAASEKGPVVAVLELDQAGATTIPFGALMTRPPPADDDTLYDSSNRTEYNIFARDSQPSSIEEYEQIYVDAFADYIVFPDFKAKNSLAENGDVVALRYYFSPECLATSLFRKISSIEIPASFPSEIRITLYGNIVKLPCEENDWATHAAFSEIYDGGGEPPAFAKNSVLRITPNDLPDYAVEYDLTVETSGLFGSPSKGVESPEEYRCTAVVYRGVRREGTN